MSDAKRYEPLDGGFLHAMVEASRITDYKDTYVRASDYDAALEEIRVLRDACRLLGGVGACDHGVPIENDCAQCQATVRAAPCGWEKQTAPDGDFYYSTGCEHAHVFTTGGWRDHDYQFCPYCSGKIIEVGEEHYTSERDAGPDSEFSIGTGEALPRG